MPYYQQHIFLCVNQRENNKDCCSKRGAKLLFDYLKEKTKQLPPIKEKKIRISSAGCLGRCDLGPVLVIYPENTWYRYETRQDIDEIVKEYLIKKKIVQRLLLPNA